ncbi:hypothetical protein BU23DRAFT_253478 [Bimuria novae-zelandiae CBS 107.79]|uniref:Uncharacterized protein n=1 Tax=Bimuria novae-zelandiae CBS 107.79 TaxID=1447943 RepID=A0A6A5VNQ7_9PLEO|nr:hypothetical protein BU23DRAFT_253478 [Bimuria novae-zelandiae CBS 107.79]
MTWSGAMVRPSHHKLACLWRHGITMTLTTLALVFLRRLTLTPAHRAPVLFGCTTQLPRVLVHNFFFFCFFRANSAGPARLVGCIERGGWGAVGARACLRPATTQVACDLGGRSAFLKARLWHYGLLMIGWTCWVGRYAALLFRARVLG